MKNILFAGFLLGLFLCTGLVNATIVVSVSSPSDGFYTTDTTPSITATCYGNATTGNMSLLTNTTGTWAINETVPYANNTAKTITMSLIADDQTFVYAVQCNDTGSINGSTANYTLIIDSTAPTCAYASANPTDNTEITDGTSQTFTATITETNLDSCYFFYDGIRYNVTNSSSTCSYTFTPLRDARYYFTANDEAGQSGSCVQRQLFLSNPNGDAPVDVIEDITPVDDGEPEPSGNFVLDFLADIFRNIANFFSGLFGG